jgi:hypothetical protein
MIGIRWCHSFSNENINFIKAKMTVEKNASRDLFQFQLTVSKL